MISMRLRVFSGDMKQLFAFMRAVLPAGCPTRISDGSTTTRGTSMGCLAFGSLLPDDHESLVLKNVNDDAGQSMRKRVG